MDTSSSHKLFVYGTLKTGQPNHRHIENGVFGVSQFLGEAVTESSYPLVVATRWNLPFLLHVPGSGHKIVGEVYEIDDPLLEWMDDFEDHPEVYLRRPINVHIISSEKTSKLNVCNLSRVEKRSCANGVDINDNKAASSSEKVNVKRDTEAATNDSEKSRENEINEDVTSQYSNPLEVLEKHRDEIFSTHVTGSSESQDSQQKLSLSEEISSSSGDSVVCWCYFIKEFPENLLKKKMLSCYDSDAMSNRKYVAEWGMPVERVEDIEQCCYAWRNSLNLDYRVKWADDSCPDNIMEALMLDNEDES